jgi:hypothetical protein
MLTGKDLDFLGIVGVILLIGVVVNNGIVLVDYVNRLRAGRATPARGPPARRRTAVPPHSHDRADHHHRHGAAHGQRPDEIGLSYKSFGLTLIGGMTTATVPDPPGGSGLLHLLRRPP